MAESVESIAFSEALRAIDAQAGILESLRSRAATVLSAASLVTAFLGGQALAGPSLINGKIVRSPMTAWSWVGVSSFGVVVVLMLVVLFPYKSRSQTSATTILTSAAVAHATVVDIQRDLARYLDANRGRNATTIRNLFWCFGVGCVFLLVEAAAWIRDLT